jgi:group I intron endonuclease
MTIYFGIYEIKNLLNRKSYIGQSATNVHGRCNGHIKELRYNHDNIHLIYAVNKYGIENFSFKVILYCEEFELTRYEDALIERDRPNRYNIRIAADSNKGLKMSEEAKRKISDGCKGKVPWNKGIPRSIETRQKMSVSTKGRQGKTCTEEAKHKISDAMTGNTNNKGHKLTEEVKRKMFFRSDKAPWNVGMHHSEETKRKMSESQKRRRECEYNSEFS